LVDAAQVCTAVAHVLITAEEVDLAVKARERGIDAAGFLEGVFDTAPAFTCGERLPLPLFATGAVLVAKQVDRSILIRQTRIDTMSEGFWEAWKNCGKCAWIAFVCGEVLTLQAVTKHRHLIAHHHATAASNV